MPNAKNVKQIVKVANGVKNLLPNQPASVKVVASSSKIILFFSSFV